MHLKIVMVVVLDVVDLHVKSLNGFRKRPAREKASLCQALVNTCSVH
jgi:hypothetical protein